MTRCSRRSQPFEASIVVRTSAVSPGARAPGTSCSATTKPCETRIRVHCADMIRLAQATDAETVRVLFREYGAELAIDLSFQNFETELADPFAVYETVLIAEGGCVALRRIDEAT